MAHTSVTLEGTVSELLAGVIASDMIDPWGNPDFNLGSSNPGAGTARIRIQNIEYWKVNSSAVLTKVGVIFVRLDTWINPFIGGATTRQDSLGIAIGSDWTVIVNSIAFPENANPGDVGFTAITGVKLMSVDPPDYTEETNRIFRTAHFAFTFNF